MNSEQTQAVNTVDESQRVTQAELHRITGLSKAWISRLAKQKKLLFDTDRKIVLAEARRQLEAAKDYRKEPQREYAEKQRSAAGGEIRPLDEQDIKEIQEIDAQIAILPPAGDAACKPTDIGLETQRSTLLKLTSEALLKQLELYERRGSLISLQDVKTAQQRIAAALRSRLLTHPKKMAPVLAGKAAAQIETLLAQEVNGILAELNTMGGD